NGLEDALSAQMSSLSLSSAAFCRLAITGSIQALCTPAAAACGLSVRDTTAAEKPAKPGPGLSGNARVAEYRRGAVGPRTPVGPGLGPERQRRVAVGGHAVLEVAGQGVDRAHVGGAVLRRQAGVGRLRPRRAAVEGEVDPGDADVGGEVTTAALAGRAIDEVV